MSLIFIYVTCKDVAQANSITATLMQEKLIACANRGAPIVSTYEWEGKIEHTEEIPLLLKTVAEKYSEVEQRVSELHSYKVPCIISWRADQVVPPYLAWVRAQVAS